MAQRGNFVTWLAVLGSIVAATAGPAAAAAGDVITLESLLMELIDRDAIARFPATHYRQLQASSYNRQSTARDQKEQGTRGWFADSDGVGSIREEVHAGRRESVLMEHQGPGCLTKIWATYFYYDFHDHVGPKVRIYLDGAQEPVIEETLVELVTRNEWPRHYGPAPPRRGTLDVPAPLARFTARAGNLYLPIPFAKSCKVTLEGKPFYNIINYRAYPAGTKVESFSRERYRAAAAAVQRTATMLEQPFEAASPQAVVGKWTIAAGRSESVTLPPGSGAVRQLSVRLDPQQVRRHPETLRSTVLRIEFDGAETVWCPLGDFFGSPNALNPFHTWSRSATAEGQLKCRWVMPYEKSARVTVENLGPMPLPVELAVDAGSWTWDERSLHFFARWRSDDVVAGDRFQDWNFVDIRGRGVFLGDQWTVLNLHGDWWGEGDEKIYVDDAYERRKFPDHFGTGTEDYYGWAGGEVPKKRDQFSHPFLANILVGSTEHDTPLGFNICARERGLDAIPFTSRLVFDMEASPGTTQREPHHLLGYSAVAFWYARPGATSNRPPLPAAAARPMVSLAELRAQSQKIADERIRRLPGAIEFERLAPTAKSAGANASKQVPAERFRPDQLSGRAQLFVDFAQPGDFVEFTLTEQFRPQRLKLYVGKCFDYGIVKVAVNGRTVAEKLDLYHDDFRVEPLDLGVTPPRENAFVVRVELVAENPRSRGSRKFCGLDCVVLSAPEEKSAASQDDPTPRKDAKSKQGSSPPKVLPALVGAPPKDWLLDDSFALAQVRESADEIVLENGLLRRVIRRAPNGATAALDNLMTSASLLRAMEPEAVVKLDGVEHRVGGLVGNVNRAYFSAETLRQLRDDPQAFRLVSHQIGKPETPIAWKRKRHAANLPWPPPGVTVDFVYRGPHAATHDITVTVHYELYDGLPVLGKWLRVKNGGAKRVRLDRFESERLACVEAESAVDDRPDGAWRRPHLDVLSDYMFKGMDAVTSNRVANWELDPQYKTQVHYNLKTPALLAVRPPVGPGVEIASGETWTSFRTYVVVYDSTDRERQGLTLRRVTRALAPWITENPLMMHVRSADSKVFRAAVDQCQAVGFEMIIYTFGSGLNMENEDPAYLARIKADVDYAHARGIEVGGYSLFSSRHIDAQNDVLHPQTGKPGGAIFGHAPCFGSAWGRDYDRKIRKFIEQTGLDLLEHDGPYPGDVCAATHHPGHRGLDDSQWVNWKLSADLYAWCQARGVYVNQPDYYFLAGGNKTAMGYRETNWSLPRAQQLIHARQNIFDGTWTKPQTAGWMFVPLTEYHGGGPAATLEPLREHLADYEAHLANALGSGVQACWRGPRLYDSPDTQALVTRWVAWYKKHRAILESDILHVRRADGRDVDYVMQANPKLRTRALAMIHNPLDEIVERSVTLPLYYTGLRGAAIVREQDRHARRFDLDQQHRAQVPVSIPPRGRTWLVVEPVDAAERP